VLVNCAHLRKGFAVHGILLDITCCICV